MKTDKDIWVENVMTSFEGRKELLPSDGLFDKILRRTQMDTKIGANHVALTVAAAMLLLFVNVFAMRSYSQNNASDAQYTVGADEQIISDYYISDYE